VYLSDDHTLQFLRKETQFVPDVMVNRPYTVWCDNPKSLEQEAQDRVKELLEIHEVPPLEVAVQKELDNIERAATNQILS